LLFFTIIQIICYKLLHNLYLSQDEWNQIQDLISLLEQFYLATKELSYQNYPTIAYARIILLSICSDLKTYSNENNLLKKVALSIYNKLQVYWEYINEISHVAAFLDPHYKRYCS